MLGFWDKNTGICAGAMPYRPNFPAIATRHIKLKLVIMCRGSEISMGTTPQSHAVHAAQRHVWCTRRDDAQAESPGALGRGAAFDRRRVLELSLCR